MNDYTATGQKADLSLPNIHCINPKCKIGLFPTKSEYEDPDFKCCVCFTLQHGLWYDCGHVHKNITEALNCKKNELTTPHTPYPTSREAASGTATNWKCPNCKYNQFNVINLNDHIYKCKNCGSTFKEEPPGQFIHLSLINPLSKDSMRNSPNPKDQIGITKLPLHLIPPPALARLSKVMELGAKKYGAFNWRETEVNLTVYLTAALRHIYSVLDGQDIDEESGIHHAAHAAACMFIILDAIEVNKLIDDRHTPGNFAQLVTQLQEKLPLPTHTPAKDAT